MSISNKLNKLYTRRSEDPAIRLFSSTDDSALIRKSLQESSMMESVRSSGFSESEYWVYQSMEEVGEDYRNKSYHEAKRIVTKLHDNGITNVDIEYQGSVTNNTCIKYVSDIDLLVVIQDFITMEPPLIAENPYKGDPLYELKSLRKKCRNIIEESFPKATIDATKSKCIHVSGGSFKREIDVVICNWLNTENYEKYAFDYFRGINVLDISKNIRVKNFPFLHNELLNEKDNNTNGKYKKLVRLVKSIRSDADEYIDVSSYEIASLLYHMPNDFILGISTPDEILGGTLKYFRYLYENQDRLSKLLVPNETVKISDSLNKKAFVALIKEIMELKNEL